MRNCVVLSSRCADFLIGRSRHQHLPLSFKFLSRCKLLLSSRPHRMHETQANDAAYCYRCSVISVYVCSVCLFVVSYCVLLCICKNIARIALPSVR